MGVADLGVRNAEVDVAGIRLDGARGRADAAGDVDVPPRLGDGSAGMGRGEGGDAAGVGIGIGHLEVKRRADEGVGVDHLRARLDVAAVDVEDGVRVQLVGYGAVRQLDAAGEQLGAEGPVVEQGAFLQALEKRFHFLGRGRRRRGPPSPSSPWRQARMYPAQCSSLPISTSSASW